LHVALADERSVVIADARPLRGRQRFAALSASTHRARSGSVWVRFVPQAGESAGATFAYSVGRSIGGAVARNRLRRRLRAIVRALVRDRALPAGLYLVGADPPASLLSHQDLREQVGTALASAGA
jgi:ribonuclease P protein component